MEYQYYVSVALFDRSCYCQPLLHAVVRPISQYPMKRRVDFVVALTFRQMAMVIAGISELSNL